MTAALLLGGAACAVDSPDETDENTLAAGVAGCGLADGVSYRTGDVVRYSNGKYYIAEHDNPGSTTTSTWYWDPVLGLHEYTTCSAVPSWQQVASYVTGNIVRYSTAATTSPSTTTPATTQSSAPGTGIRPGAAPVVAAAAGRRNPSASRTSS